MTARNLRDERRWANTDAALHFNGVTPRSKEPDWRRVYGYLLKLYDYDAAELVKMRNLVSDECGADEHGDCAIPETCACSHHSIRQLTLEHLPLRTLSEAQEDNVR